MNYDLLNSTWIIIVGFQILWHCFHSRWHLHCIRTPLQIVRNLHNVSAFENYFGFFQIYFRTPFWFPCCLWGFCLVLFCFVFVANLLIQLHEEGVCVCVYSILTYIWVMAKKGWKKKHVFIYWWRYGLEKQWHTDQFVAQKSGIVFLLLRNWRIESFSEHFVNKKGSSNTSYFQLKLFGFRNISINYWYCSVITIFGPCHAYGPCALKG